MKRALVLVIALLWTGRVAAQSDGGTESPFSLGAGSHELAQSGAAMAVADPTTAPYWNSSRLATAERFALTAFHTRLYEAGINYQYFGLVAPTLDYGSFGLGIFRHSVSDIDRRDASNLSLGDFGLSQMRIYAAYGRALSDFNLGVSTFIDYNSLDTYKSASSPGLDLSLGRAFELSSEVVPRITAAINATNVIRPGMRLASETFSYARAVTAGVSVDFAPTRSRLHRMVLSASYQKTDNVSGAVRLGAEYRGLDLFGLRFGLEGGAASVGAGLTYRSFDFDYAMVDRDYGSIHMFTLTSAFGLPTSERRVRRAQKREEEFDRKMRARFVEQNRALLENLVADGTEQVAREQFADAVASFEGALLLARSIDADTARIVELVRGAKAKQEQRDRRARLAANLDSAGAHLKATDYLAARYFANLALADEPASDSAKRILQRCEKALAGSTKTREMLKAQLDRIEDLLARGKVDEAEQVARSLVEYAPNDDAVKLAAMQVELERWRRSPQAARDTKRPPAGPVAAQEPRKEQAAPEKPVQRAAADETTREPMSPVLQKEVEAAYRSAQEAFGAGSLQKAIGEWEKVERLAPAYQSTRSYLVRAYKFVGVELYAQKQRTEAVAAWKKGAALDPSDAELRDYIEHTELEIAKLKSLSYDQR
jgi:tetratricopeptide (TPR) repeat protein